MSRLGTETAFEVLSEVKKLEAEGRDVISFAIGEPDFDTPEFIRDAAKQALDEGYTHYGESAGWQPLRETIAACITRSRGIQCSADQVVVAPGAKPFIGFTVLSVVEEGDEVIYPNPGFPIYDSWIRFVGAEPVPLPLVESKKFSFEADVLEGLVTDKTKLIILNSPHNPTGGVIPPEDLEVVARICRERDIWVFSDEVYSRMQYEGEFASIVGLPGMQERTVLVDGHSKTYAMTGWRLGYGVMNGELAARMARLMTNTNSCTCTFSQVAAKAALEGPQEPAEEMVRELRRRRDLIVNGLNQVPGFRCLVPPGAFYVFPNVTEVCRRLRLKDARALQEFLLHEGGVAVLARTCFGPKNAGETEEYVRLAYAVAPEIIENGVKRIREAIEDEDRIERFRQERPETASS